MKPRPINERNLYVCTYINSRGRTVQKLFTDRAEGLAFTQVLDGRIERGTCGGYSFSAI